MGILASVQPELRHSGSRVLMTSYAADRAHAANMVLDVWPVYDCQDILASQIIFVSYFVMHRPSFAYRRWFTVACESGTRGPLWELVEPLAILRAVNKYDGHQCGVKNALRSNNNIDLTSRDHGFTQCTTIDRRLGRHEQHLINISK
jgi:hypothetical protein